jgi:hypothetical protein
MIISFESNAFDDFNQWAIVDKKRRDNYHQLQISLQKMKNRRLSFMHRHTRTMIDRIFSVFA